MKKRWFFTGAAALLAVFFLSCVLAVGGSTGWFGLEELISDKPTDWQYDYQTTWDLSASSVDGLEITWSDGPVYVRPCEGDLITVTEYADRPLEEDERLALSSAGGALKIRWDHGLLPLGVFENLEKRLVVEVPQTVAGQMEELKCVSVAGEIYVDGVTAQEIDVTSAAGDLYLSSVYGEKAKVFTVSGDIQWNVGNVESLSAATSSGYLQIRQVQAEECALSNVTGGLDFLGSGNVFSVDNISGPVRMELSICPEEGEFRSVSGGISLTLPENDGFQAEYSSVSGSFDSDFPGKGEHGSLLYGKGRAQLRFTTTSGNMAIRKGGASKG